MIGYGWAEQSERRRGRLGYQWTGWAQQGGKERVQRAGKRHWSNVEHTVDGGGPIGTAAYPLDAEASRDAE